MWQGFDLVDQLNEGVRSRLLDRGGFAGPPAVEVLTERLSDFEQKIRVALQSKLGLCLIVSTPEIQGGEVASELVAKVSVIVNENVIQNQFGEGTRITAANAALRVYLSLLNWAPGGGWSPLVPIPETSPIRLIGAPQEGSPVVSYEIALRSLYVFGVEDETPVALSGTP